MSQKLIKFIKTPLYLLLFALLICESCGQTKRVLIKSAIYKSEAQQLNVLHIVEKHLLASNNGEVIIDLSSYKSFNEAFGDPHPGYGKSFKLIYHYINQGKEITLTVNELDFSCNRVILLKPQHSY